MKAKLLTAVLAAALTASFAAVAADEATKDGTPVAAGKAVKSEKAKKKVKPHSHVQEKNGPAPAEPSTAEGEAQKPLHEHAKFHKQQ